MSATDFFPYDRLRQSVESLVRDAAAQLVASTVHAAAQEVRDFRDSVLEDTKACNLSSSHFKMDLNTMLQNYKQHIKNQGTHHNIDAGAIAGAIAWEYEENKAGRYSDYLQFTQWADGARLAEGGLLARRLKENVPGVGGWASQVGSGGLTHGEGLGWGSMHTSVARKLRPSASLAELQCLRMEAENAVTLIAEEMDRLAKMYFELTGKGVWIHDKPSVLALFYHTGENTVKRSAKRRKDESPDKDGFITLEISPDEMARWVWQNMFRFCDFSTTPSAPTGKNVIRVKTDMGCGC